MMVYGWGGPGDGIGFGLGIFFQFIFFGLAIFMTYWSFRQMSRQGNFIPPRRDALEILRQRLAKGEISVDEYRRIKEELEKD